MNSKKEYQSAEQREPMFEMPECEFSSLTCGSCIYYEQYGFGKAFCNCHRRDTSSWDTVCGYYKYVMSDFSLTCGRCMYYEQYGFGKAFCNYHRRDTSSSDTACGYYK